MTSNNDVVTMRKNILGWGTVVIAGILILQPNPVSVTAHTATFRISLNESILSPEDILELNTTLTDVKSDHYYMIWSKTMPGGQYPASGRLATDGSFLFFIGTVNVTDVDKDVLIKKMDMNGTEIWTRTWGISEEDFPLDIIVYKDMLLVVGASADGYWPDPLFILAYDKAGKALWNRTWDGGVINWCTGLVGVDDALYLSGWSISPSLNSDAVILKFNLTDLDFEWSHRWGSRSDEYGDDITFLNKSLYMSVYDSAGNGYAGIVKFDMNGTEAWNRTWGPGSDEYSIATDGNKLFIVGSEKTVSNRSSYFRVLTGDGEMLAARFYGKSNSSSYFSQILVHEGVAYCAGGVRDSSSANSSEAVLVLYDTGTLTEILNLTWSGQDEDICNGVAIANNADIYLGGRTKNISNGTWELFLLKYTNRLANSGLPVSISVKGPEGREYLNTTEKTDSGGAASTAFSLPPDAPEGSYGCIVNADVCGTVLTNRSSFSVVWPWTPVLEVSPSGLSGPYLPGDSFSLRAYAGHEYRPANASRPAPGFELDAVLLAPDGSRLWSSRNGTGPDGWADLRFDIPENGQTGTLTIRISGFEGQSREIRIEVKAAAGQAPVKKEEPPPVPAAPVVGATVTGLLAVGIAIAATEAGKYGLLVPFAPLYTRIRRDRALDHRIRQRMLGYLMENPGQHYNALKKVLRISNSVLVYHVLVLEREGFITSRRDGVMKRFYLSSAKALGRPQLTPGEIDASIVAELERRPGQNQKELVDRLVLRSEVVGYHLRKLVRERRLARDRKGRTRVYYPIKK